MVVPYLPAAPGLKCMTPRRRSIITFRMCECPQTNSVGGAAKSSSCTLPVVVPGIASDVFEQDFHPFFDKAKPLGECSADFSAVGIAIDGTKGSYGREAFSDGHRADVARMPYLVGFPGVVQDGRIEGAVGVGEQKYFLHRVQG